MNNQLSVFEGKQVVILLPEDVNFPFKGDFLIRARDAAEILEYATTQKLTELVKEKYLILVRNSGLTKTGNPNLNNAGETFLTNHGLNQALANSTMPKAEPFQDWLYEKVLPSIQKTGSYAVQIKDSYVIDDPIKRAERWIEEQKEKQELQTQVIEMQPKVDYLEKIVANPSTMTTTQISKDYGMTAQEFNKLLHSYHIQYKRGENWYLYEEHDDFGYTQSHTHLVENEKGVFNTVNMKWTQVGRKFLYQFLKEKNILPLCDISTINRKTLLQKC
jgi:anti-repressor protein